MSTIFAVLRLIPTTYALARSPFSGIVAATVVRNEMADVSKIVIAVMELATV